MEVRVTRSNEISKQVEVEVEEELIDRKVNQELRKIAKNARIDGFRKGKVPVAIIRKRYGQSARMEAIENLVQEVVAQVVQTEELRDMIHLSRPQVDSGVASGNVVYSMTAENFPEVTPVDYKGVAVELLRSSVDEEAVDAQINRRLEQFTTLVPVEDRDTVEANDILQLSLQGLGEGPQSRLSQQDQEVDLGREGLLPGLADGLIGAKKDDKTVVTVTLPDDFGVEELAGQDIQLEIEVHEILRKDVPEKDDEFAKETGEADTYDELVEKIRADLLKTEQDANENDARNRLMDAILEKNLMEVPPLYLLSQGQEQVWNQLQMFEQQGLDWRKIGLDINGLAERATEDIRPNVQRAILLQAIGKAEALEATDEDVDAHVKRLAEENDVTEEQVRASYKDDTDDQARLRQMTTIERVLDFLWSEATITEVDALTVAQTQEEGDDNDEG